MYLTFGRGPAGGYSDTFEKNPNLALQSAPVLIRVLAIALLLALPGCAPKGASRPVGMVVLVGVDQVLSLNRMGVVAPISGPPAVVAQLDRLVGARVAVRGRISDSSAWVRAYEMIEAPDGMAPYIGRLVVDQSGVRLQDETTGTRLALRSADIETLKRHHGDRLWVTGSIVGPQLLLIAHWGVIVPADP